MRSSHLNKYELIFEISTSSAIHINIYIVKSESNGYNDMYGITLLILRFFLQIAES